MKKELPSIAIGVGIYFTIYFLLNAYGNLLIENGILKMSGEPASSNYHPLLFINTILNTLIYTLPAYATGWLSIKSGTINGLVIVIVATFIQSVLIQTNWSIGFFSFILLLHSLWFWVEGSIFTIVVGGLCGAAGELHRKKRIKKL